MHTPLFWLITLGASLASSQAFAISYRCTDVIYNTSTNKAEVQLWVEVSPRDKRLMGVWTVAKPSPDFGGEPELKKCAQALQCYLNPNGRDCASLLPR